MPLDCLAAFEDNFSDSAHKDYMYELYVQLFYGPKFDLNDIFGDFPPNEEDDPTPHIDAKAFVAKLEVVDISSISADDMTCFHCWSDFGESEGKVELKAGEIWQITCPSRCRALMITLSVRHACCRLSTLTSTCARSVASTSSLWLTGTDLIRSTLPLGKTSA